jgi:hypothetical protein
MFTVEIDGRTVNADVTFYTAQLYEAEFRGDVIQELFSMQDDIMDGMVITEEDGETVARYDLSRIDLTKVGWLAVNKLLWAAVKTADETTPGYQAWCKRTRGVDIWAVRDVLMAELSDCFFRPGTAEAQVELEKKDGQVE